MNYTFPTLLSIIGGEAYGQSDPNMVSRYLLTDCRQLVAGGQSVFFAIVTRKNDGHHFIPGLLKKGVRIFVVSQMNRQWVRDYPDAGFIVVSDTGREEDGKPESIRPDAAVGALQRLAAFHRAQFQYPVIGITGSNGKTIVKEWLFQLLHPNYQVVRNPRSYNSQIGVPLSVWQMSADHNLAMLEAGISTIGEMALLEQMIHPTIGIITNIGPAHDSGFVSRAEKIGEKLMLFKDTGALIYCSDHHEIANALGAADARLGRIFSWGRTVGADLQLEDVKKLAGKSELYVKYNGDNACQFSFSIPFIDAASIENAMHCAAAMLLLGLTPEIIRERMPLLQAVAMRLELKEGINQCSVINDSYNSDLSSLAIAIDFLNNQTRYERTTLIISDILQTGLEPATLYRQVADLVKAKKLGRIIGIGPSISSQFAMFAQPAMFYPDTDTFLREFDFSLFDQEAILLKGARPFAFEKLSQRLQQKDHQTVLEVDLDALVHNLNVFRAHIGKGVKVMAMVKAFSYGSGSVEIASMLQYHHVDYLAVAYADEGKELRKGGIILPIVVMNPEQHSFDTLLAYDLEPEIYSLELLRRLTGIVTEKTINVHIKIDSGMHRLGFLPEQIDELILLLKAAPLVRVVSVFSHLAASDDPSHDAFTRKQIRVFTTCCEQISRGIGYVFLRHLSNSAAVGRFPEARFDMVRLGIGLYGISNNPDIQSLLQHVSTFKSVISQLKKVVAGETIGYNRAGVATYDMDIAIIPVGYADGLRRQLSSGKGTLHIGGQLRPIVGQISMDMCAVDVTGLPVSVGDEVIIFGRERTVIELARDMETIPYEVLTSVSHRVKRVYFQG